MGKGQDVLNFWLPWNHSNAGATVKMPEVEVINTSNGNKTKLGGNEYEYLTTETATGANRMTINDGATSADVTNAINEYNQRIDEYNAQERAYREYIDKLAQRNWESEFEFEKEKYRQQLKENEINRTREDTAYQRTMHDMALAGINPLMVGRFGLDPTSIGQVAGNAPATPSFHGGTPSAIQSNVSAVTSDIASKRSTATEQAKIELDYQRLQNDKETAWATINQGYELFKGNAELQEKLKKYDRQTNEILEGLKTKGQKELQKDAQNFEKSLFDLEYELKERGQWLDFGAKIAAAGLGLVGDIFAFKKFQLPKNFGKGIPNAQEYGGGLPKPGEVLPGPEGTTRSPGGIYY